MSVSLLILGTAVYAKDRPTATVHQKPMLLCYAVSQRNVDRAEPEATTRDEDFPQVHHYTRPEHRISVSSITEFRTDNVSEVSTQTVFLKKASDEMMERKGRAKFCMGNLLEGSLYDFKKKNNLHFEIASPTYQFRENSSQLRFDQLYVAFLFRFKM